MFEDLQTLERADKLDCGTASQFRPALTPTFVSRLTMRSRAALPVKP